MAYSEFADWQISVHDQSYQRDFAAFRYRVKELHNCKIKKYIDTRLTLMTRGKNSARTDATFNWVNLPATDIDRLAQNLRRRAKADDDLSLTSEEALNYTKEVLKNQQNTCLLAGGDHSYCWNEPRELEAHLKLQWSHKVPMAHSPIKALDNFVLLCARCNNQLQSSRTLGQLRAELTHKLAVLDRLLQEDHANQKI